MTQRITKLTLEQIQHLKKLHDVGYTSAIIAGGAVRDTYFKKPIIDIDVFVLDPRYNGDDNLVTDKYISNLFNVSAISTSFNKNIKTNRLTYPKHSTPYSYGSRYINHIKNVPIDGILYQLILVSISPIEYVMKHFYVDIARCYCDGTRLRYTNEFLNDARNKTLTIAGEMTKTEYIFGLKRYIEKIRRKFPDYVVVDTLKDKFKKR